MVYGNGERMNVDLKFDHSAAARDFGFLPRQFRLGASLSGIAGGLRWRTQRVDRKQRHSARDAV